MLIAGIGSVPFFSLSWSLSTPVVVSSEIPFTPLTNAGYLSSTMFVRSPPSSRIMFSGCPSPKNKVCSIHQSNSSSVIPFQA